MKVRYLATGVLVGLFSVVSHADSCIQTSFANLLGTSCTIGQELFSFSNAAFSINADPQSVIFTPLLISGMSAGFEVSGLRGTSSSQPGQDQQAFFFEPFSVVPLSGTITSATATLNGVSQHNSGSITQMSYAILDDAGINEFAIDEYISHEGVYSHTKGGGGSEPSFNGDFRVENFSFSGDGTTSFTGFTSADFIFTAPEGSELAMLGTTALLIATLLLLCAIKKDMERS